MGKVTDKRLPAVREFLRLHNAGEPVPEEMLDVVAGYVRDSLPKGRGRPRGTTKVPQDRQDRLLIQHYFLSAMWVGAPECDVLERLAEEYGVEPETIRNYARKRADFLAALDAGKFPESMWSEINEAVHKIAKKIPSK